MHLVFTPVSRPLLLVKGDPTGHFPVRRIYCVGRNYEAHAHEMGVTEKQDPVFFTKSAETVLPCHEQETPDVMLYPPKTNDLHHEVELVVGLNKPVANGTVEQALDAIYGYAVGLDMTRRDLQGLAKAQSHPWDMAKNFTHSAIIGPMLPLSEAPAHHFEKSKIWLSVNGHMRQQGHISDMIWSVGEIIAKLSEYDALEAGDIIFTGTPEGVGAVQAGDLLVACVEGLPLLKVKVNDQPAS